MHEALDGDGVVLDALVEQLVGGRVAEVVGEALELAHGRAIERRLDRSLAAGALPREAHAVGGQQSRQRMHEHRLDAERVGDQAGVLPAGRAEAVQRIFGNVVAALHGDLLDGVGHVLDRDANGAVGDLLGRTSVANLGRELGEGAAHRFGIERLVVRRPEDPREKPRVELAEHDIGVGDGERPAAAVALGTRIGAGARRADAEACAVVSDDRAAARRHRMHAQHRHGEAHAGDLRLEGALVLAGEMRDVGRRAAHVEADDAVEAGALARLRHADDTAGGTRQDRVAAAERLRRLEAARRRHEQQVRIHRCAEVSAAETRST